MNFARGVRSVGVVSVTRVLYAALNYAVINDQRVVVCVYKRAKQCVRRLSAAMSSDAAMPKFVSRSEVRDGANHAPLASNPIVC